jgi:hypothetical protein
MRSGTKGRLRTNWASSSSRVTTAGKVIRPETICEAARRALAVGLIMDISLFQWPDVFGFRAPKGFFDVVLDFELEKPFVELKAAAQLAGVKEYILPLRAIQLADESEATAKNDLCDGAEHCSNGQ